MAQSTYFKWKSGYAGMSLSELKRMKQLEEENIRLKRMYANLRIDNELLKEVIVRR